MKGGARKLVRVIFHEDIYVTRGKLSSYPFPTINLNGSQPKMKGNSASEIGILYRKQFSGAPADRGHKYLV